MTIWAFQGEFYENIQTSQNLAIIEVRFVETAPDTYNGDSN